MSTTLRVIIASLLVLGVGFALLIRQLEKRVERQYLEAAEEPMVDAAQLAAAQLAAALLEATLSADGTLDVGLVRRAWTGLPDRRISAKIYEVVKTTVDMNLYVVDASGLCLFDSRGVDEGKQLSDRRDVALTLAGNYGARSTRDDDADDRSSVMFVGAPVRQGERVLGMVSVIKPQRSMFEFMGQMRRAIKVAGWTMFGLVGCGVVLLSWWLLRPLRKLTSYAQNLAKGTRAEPPPLAGSEAVALGAAFEGMRDALEDRNYVETYIKGLTHEIKSPVAAIRSAVELAAEPGVDPSVRQRFLGNIQAESVRMQQIIDKLLTLSEIESRKSLEKREILNLRLLVENVCAQANPAFAARNVSLTLHGEPNVIVSGDEVMLAMAVDNILQNALDFSPSGSAVSITVTCHGTLAEVAVDDEGPGVPAFALERVFDRFYSLQHPATGKKSSGLGLCLVREVAQLHGGTASVENRGQGGARAKMQVRVEG